MRKAINYMIALLSVVFITNIIQAQVPEGYSWQDVKNVDFGAGANHFSIKAASKGLGGEVQLRLDAADGAVIGHAFFHHTGGANHFIDYDCDLNQTVSGTHDVYMNFIDYAEATDEYELNVGDFQFSLIEGESVVAEGDLNVYPLVPGLDQSPYYEFKVQKVSELNSTNFEDATNWETPFAFYTKNIKGAPNTEAYFRFTTDWSHTYCNFELDANTPIVVKITRLDKEGAPSGPITAAAPHPARKVISCEIINGDVYVVMENPAQVSVDIDGQLDGRDAPRKLAPPIWWGDYAPYANEMDGTHAVSIFANPFINDKPDPVASDVVKVYPGDPIPEDDGSWTTMYFMPGVHKSSVDTNGNEREWRTDDIITLNDNRQYYIPGDAILYGNFNSRNNWGGSNSNIRLYGHGTVCGTKNPHFNDFSPELEAQVDGKHNLLRTFEVHGGSNVIIEGITSADPAEHGLYIYGKSDEEPNYIRWAKIISWRVNNDGTVVSGKSFIEDCFIRHQDDANYIEGSGVSRLILWSDVNGAHLRGSWIADRRSGSYPSELPTVLYYEDIDVIYARAVFGFGSVISGGSLVSKAYSDGVVNTGQHLFYRNINVEDANPVKVLLDFNTKEDKTKALKGIRFANINYQSTPAFNDNGNPEHYQVNTLKGNANDDLQYFVFDNVHISGEQMDLNLLNNPDYFDAQYVKDFTFRLHDTIASSGNVLIRTATNGSIALDTVPGSNELTLTATPINSDYEFVGWGGDYSGTDPVATIVMDENKTITAQFKQIIYTITAEENDKGTFVYDPAAPWYLPGTEVSVKAAGNIGYSFESWGGDISGTENPIVVTMDSNINISASFIAVPTYQVATNVDHGTISLDPPGGKYSEGEEITVTYMKEIGYDFDKWSGDLTGATNPATLIVDSDKQITAQTVFKGAAITAYTINCGGGAYAAPDGTEFSADMNFTGGTTFSASNPISGSDYQDVYQSERYGDVVYNFDLTNGEYNVTLMFAEIYAKEVNKRIFNVLFDGNVVIESLDIFANVGKDVVYDTTINLFISDGNLSVGFESLIDNAKISGIMIEPVFEGSTYTLTTEAANGVIELDPAGSVFMENTEVMMNAIPNEGFAFQDWSGDLSGDENPATLVIDGDKTVSALFEEEEVVEIKEDVATSIGNIYPNPFVNEVNIPYSVIEGSHVKLSVFNCMGQKVVVLVNEYKKAGDYTVKFKAENDKENALNNGVYFIRLETDNGQIQVKKAMLMR